MCPDVYKRQHLIAPVFFASLVRIHPADSVISVKDSSFWSGVLHDAVQQFFGKSITVVFCVKEHLNFLPVGSKPLCRCV